MSSDDMSRFTAWLSQKERDHIRERAKLLHSSENYVVRLCIRSALGMDSREISNQTNQTVPTEQEVA